MPITTCAMIASAETSGSVHEHPSEQLESVVARLEIVRGRKLSFDEEARRIYGVTPPRHDDEFYLAIHRQLDAALPGPGPLDDGEPCGDAHRLAQAEGCRVAQVGHRRHAGPQPVAAHRVGGGGADGRRGCCRWRWRG